MKSFTLFLAVVWLVGSAAAETSRTTRAVSSYERDDQTVVASTKTSTHRRIHNTSSRRTRAKSRKHLRKRHAVSGKRAKSHGRHHSRKHRKASKKTVHAKRAASGISPAQTPEIPAEELPVP